MLDRRITLADLIRHCEHLIACVEAGSAIQPVDIEKLCALAPLAGDSLLRAEFRECYPSSIAMMVRASPPLREVRLLDVLDFAGVQLLCATGAIINNEPTTANGKRYSYLRIEHSSDASPDKRIRLNRIIANAPEDKAVGFGRSGDFRSYCRQNLKLRAPIRSMKEPKLGRSAAIQLARVLYDTSMMYETWQVSSDAYAALIARMFAAADRYHGKVD